jgi:hypothetical protein
MVKWMKYKLLGIAIQLVWERLNLLSGSRDEGKTAVAEVAFRRQNRYLDLVQQNALKILGRHDMKRFTLNGNSRRRK